jgi:hypothetical protein
VARHSDRNDNAFAAGSWQPAFMFEDGVTRLALPGPEMAPPATRRSRYTT